MMQEGRGMEGRGMNCYGGGRRGQEEKLWSWMEGCHDKCQLKAESLRKPGE